MDIVKAENLKYEYIQVDEEGNEESRSIAVDGVSLDIKAGDFVAILGHNGSGKSTLAKHINAILLPTEGSLYVDGKDTRDESKLWEIRQTAGMVFQNPDNQIIGTIVEEDVGFGPENMGVPQAEIWKRVEQSLKSVGMWEYRTHSPNKLSGGQKQRVAIAGVVAMRPKCIVLDEPTAHAGSQRKERSDPHGSGTEPPGEGNGSFDYPLYGRGDRGRPGNRHGSGKNCHAGNAEGGVFPRKKS